MASISLYSLLYSCGCLPLLGRHDPYLFLLFVPGFVPVVVVFMLVHARVYSVLPLLRTLAVTTIIITSFSPFCFHFFSFLLEFTTIYNLFVLLLVHFFSLFLPIARSFFFDIFFSAVSAFIVSHAWVSWTPFASLTMDMFSPFGLRIQMNTTQPPSLLVSIMNL